MSITSDIRNYADTAVNQGKQSLASAQAQLNDVTGAAGEYVARYTSTARDNASSIADKANEAVTDLRTTAEKAINLDAIKTAIEPYLAQAKDSAPASPTAPRCSSPTCAVTSASPRCSTPPASSSARSRSASSSRCSR